MFEIEPSEIVLLAVIGLLVLGPKGLLNVADRLWQWVGSARRKVAQWRRQLEHETGFSPSVERPRPKLRVVPRSAPFAPADSGDRNRT